MVIVHVHVVVKSGMEEAFVAATRVNARASLGEPGVLRFDVVRQVADPRRFVLVEVFRDEDAPAAHKATAHYAAWRDAVEPMMAEPRVGTKYAAVEPESADGWRHT
jgi:autoinducer 2-degrading protein